MPRRRRAKKEMFTVMLTAEERRWLDALADANESTAAATLRAVLHDAGRTSSLRVPKEPTR